MPFLVALDVTGRLAVPGALFAAATGAASSASVAAALATAALALRGLVGGIAVEREVRRTFADVIGAACRAPVLSAPREAEVALRLLSAARELAVFRAQVLPFAVAQGLSFGVVLVVIGLQLGAFWLGLTVLGGLAIALLVGVGHRRLGRAAEAAWQRFCDAAGDLLVLVQATLSLRAHGRQEAHAARVLGAVDAMARAERTVLVTSGALGLLPASVAILAATFPMQFGSTWLSAALGGESAAEVVILAGAAAFAGLSFARSIEGVVTSRPQRAEIAAYLARSSGAWPGRTGSEAAPSLLDAPLTFDNVSCRHEHAEQLTPAPVSFTWSSRGLALVGPNGAGKSTLLHAVLGLMPLASGALRVGSVDLATVDSSAFARKVAFLSQAAFVAPASSVAWHLRLFASHTIDDDALHAALIETGLMPVLVEHAKRANCAPLDVVVGELSGGERQRMHWARILVQRAELVILDEPEVGLDADGRQRARELLSTLTATRRVLVVAHDLSIIPDDFSRLTLRSGGPALGEPGVDELP